MTDEQVGLAADIFTALVGEGTSFYDDEREIRSAPHTDTVDVCLGGQWFRISSEPIDEPISIEAHRDEA